MRPVDDQSGHRAEIHDAARAARNHVSTERAGSPEKAVHVDVHHLPPFIVGCIEYRVQTSNASAIDQYVDVTVLADQQISDALQRSGVCDVDRLCRRRELFGAQRANCTVQRLCIAVEQHHLRAALRQSPR